MRASATLSLVGADGKVVKGKAAILVKAPDSFRIEVYGPFGQAVVVLIASDGEFSITSSNKTRYFSPGEKMPFLLTPAQLASLLMGLKMNARQWADGTFRLKRDMHGNITELSKTGKGTPELKAVFNDFESLNGRSFPFDLRIDSNGERISIHYRSVEMNPELDGRFFTRPQPAHGAR